MKLVPLQPYSETLVFKTIHSCFQFPSEWLAIIEDQFGHPVFISPSLPQLPQILFLLSSLSHYLHFQNLPTIWKWTKRNAKIPLTASKKRYEGKEQKNRWNPKKWDANIAFPPLCSHIYSYFPFNSYSRFEWGFFKNMI